MNFKYKMIGLSIIFLFFIIILLIVSNNDKSFKSETLIAALAALVTLLFAIRNYLLEYDKFFKELFLDFNLRYNEYNNELNSITDDSVLTDSQKKTVIDYFNLCAEEYMWDKRGRIPKSIYSSWLNGTIFHLTKAPIKELMDIEFRNNKKSYYGWIEFMKNKL